MLLSEFDRSDFLKALGQTGKAKGQVGQSTIQISTGYIGHLPGGTVETFVHGPLSVTVDGQNFHDLHHYTPSDALNWERVKEDIHYMLNKAQESTGEDFDLTFEAMENRAS